MKLSRAVFELSEWTNGQTDRKTNKWTYPLQNHGDVITTYCKVGACPSWLHDDTTPWQLWSATDCWQLRIESLLRIYDELSPPVGMGNRCTQVAYNIRHKLINTFVSVVCGGIGQWLHDTRNWT